MLRPARRRRKDRNWAVPIKIAARRKELHSCLDSDIHLSKSTSYSGVLRPRSDVSLVDFHRPHSKPRRRFSPTTRYIANSRTAIPRRHRRDFHLHERVHADFAFRQIALLEISKLSLRKEVIQPQVPLRLPCYDLVPVTEPGVDIALVRRLRPFPAPMT